MLYKVNCLDTSGFVCKMWENTETLEMEYIIQMEERGKMSSLVILKDWDLLFPSLTGICFSTGINGGC